MSYMINLSSDTGDGGTTSKIGYGGKDTVLDRVKLHYEPYNGNFVAIDFKKVMNYKDTEKEHEIVFSDSLTGKSIVCRYRGGRLIGDCETRGNLNLLHVEEQAEVDILER